MTPLCIYKHAVIRETLYSCVLFITMPLLVTGHAPAVLMLQATRVVRLVRILRLLKLVRLLRLFKLINVVRRLEIIFGRGTMKLCLFVGFACLIVHMLACFFYFTAVMSSDDLTSTWVEHAGRSLYVLVLGLGFRV